MRTTFEDRPFAAFLFDMDGTVLDSLASANRVWTRWAESHGIDPAALLATMHGRRAVDTVRDWLRPGMDVAREAEWIAQAEVDDVEGVVAIAGAPRFLAALPPARWAIVTSAPRVLALRRMEAAGIPRPDLLVTAEDVTRGKPAPDAYLHAARVLRVDIRDCLVFEDAPAGIAAAEASGAAVAVVAATHASPSGTAHPQFMDYDGLSVAQDKSGALRLVPAA